MYRDEVIICKRGANYSQSQGENMREEWRGWKEGGEKGNVHALLYRGRKRRRNDKLHEFRVYVR